MESRLAPRETLCDHFIAVCRTWIGLNASITVWQYYQIHMSKLPERNCFWMSNWGCGEFTLWYTWLRSTSWAVIYPLGSTGKLAIGVAIPGWFGWSHVRWCWDMRLACDGFTSVWGGLSFRRVGKLCVLRRAVLWGSVKMVGEKIVCKPIWLTNLTNL